MGSDSIERLGQTRGSLGRAASSQLPSRGSTSHLPPRYPEQGRHIHTRQPQHQGKLVSAFAVRYCLSVQPPESQTMFSLQVLLFFILIIGSFTVVIQHKLFLPVSACW